MCVGAVFASENMTANELDLTDQIPVEDSEDIVIDNISQTGESKNMTANVYADDVVAYYKQSANFVSYIKDSDNQPIQNKTLKIQIGEKTYSVVSDNKGKATLALNLKPDNYNVKVVFEQDDDYNEVTTTAKIKIKKAPLAIKMSNYNTYYGSDLFFKVKVYNTVTKKAVIDIRVKFKVYNVKTKKYSYYYSTSDKNGVAKLKKNLKVGKYQISAQIKDSKNKKYISYKNSKNKVSMNVKATEEKGCCSFYLQVSGTEAVCGFRRDGTEAADIKITALKWAGKTAVKQYKVKYGYFSHIITSSDGWMVGNGGIEDGSISKAIEKLAEDMVKSKKIKTATLKKIQKYKKQLGFGHFSIKAPNGKFAVVWQTGYITGKLKPGEFLSAPNSKSYYRHSTYAKYGTDVAKAAIKVGATDGYGVNRREVIVHHWKATTDKNFKTTATIKCYAANDNGKLVGKSTAYLKDNIYFKSKFFNKNKLPKTPNMVYLGTHNFGNIDKLIKTPTVVSAPAVTNQFNTSKYFKVTIKDKNTKKVLNNIKIKIKIKGDNFTKYYTLSTDSKGIAKISTESLLVGKYTVAISPANNKYLISASSKITIN